MKSSNVNPRGPNPLNHIKTCNNIFKSQFWKTITNVEWIWKKPEVNILQNTISYTNIQFSRLCSQGAIVNSTHWRQPFWVLATILDSKKKWNLIAVTFRAVYIANIYHKTFMSASENEIQLFTSKPVIRCISQFWADILEFGGHLGFHSTWNLYIWFLCIHHNTFWHEYQLCSSISRRYSYTLPTAILSFDRHLGFRLSYNLCPGDFLKLCILPTYPDNFRLVSEI